LQAGQRLVLFGVRLDDLFLRLVDDICPDNEVAVLERELSDPRACVSSVVVQVDAGADADDASPENDVIL